MRICLYGASSNQLDSIYTEKTKELGVAIGKRGHNLVYGGGARGLMGAAASGVVEGGGSVIGVAPNFFNVDGVLFDKCEEMIYTETMRERKRIMEEKAEAFIIVPGGLGTFDELFEIMTLKQLGQHEKPMAIYNINGYYNAFEKLLDVAVEGKFMTKKSKEICPLFDDIDELLNYIENYDAEDYDFTVMKKVEGK